MKVKREIAKGCLYLLADQRQKLVKIIHITDISSLGHSKRERLCATCSLDCQNTDSQIDRQTDELMSSIFFCHNI